MTTVNDIQLAVARKVDLANTVDNSSLSYAIRLGFINEREKRWSEVIDHPSLYREVNSMTSTATGNASISLPDAYQRSAGYLTVGGEEYTKIAPQKRGMYVSSDKVYWNLNDNSGNKTAVLNKDVASGASIYIPYYTSTGSLASPSDIVLCPNPQYIIEGVIADVWESREDSRYLRKQEEADVILRNMVEMEQTPTEGEADDSVKTVEQTKYNFRMGRD